MDVPPFRPADNVEQFRLALQCAPTGMLMVDRQGRITFANTQIEKLFGYTQAELVGSPIDRLVPAQFRDRHSFQRGDYFDARQTRPIGAGQELHGLHRDGTHIPVEIGLTSVTTADDEFVLCSVVDITRRKQSAQQLRERTADLTASLRERDVLLQEIHHRVKNNLQVISSLINLQIRKLDVSASRDVLKECKTRIEAISLIHQKLYQSTNFANVQFGDYARSLAGNVLHVAEASERITLEYAFENIALPVDKAIPCGLILNELLTNVVKHAYPDQSPGTVRLSLQHAPENYLRLEVSDRGVGMPNPEKTRDSLGLQLVATLTEQLQGELQVTVDQGTSIRIEFPFDPKPAQAH